MSAATALKSTTDCLSGVNEICASGGTVATPLLARTKRITGELMKAPAINREIMRALSLAVIGRFSIGAHWLTSAGIRLSIEERIRPWKFQMSDIHSHANEPLRFRVLPDQVLKRVPESDRRLFTDLVRAAGATEAELEEIAVAPDPWIALGVIEARAKSDGRAAKIAKDGQKLLRDLDRAVQGRAAAPVELDREALPGPPKPKPMPAAVRKLPEEPQSDGIDPHIKAMPVARAQAEYQRFCRVYHLDTPGVVPAQVLNPSQLRIYSSFRRHLGLDRATGT